MGLTAARSGPALWKGLRRPSSGGGRAGYCLFPLPLPGVAVGCGLADLLNGSAGPPLSVFAFAALQVGGNPVLNHPTVDLEPVPIDLGSCGWNSHRSQYGWVESFSQINKRGSAGEFGCLFDETSAEIPTGIGQFQSPADRARLERAGSLGQVSRGAPLRAALLRLGLPPDTPGIARTTPQLRRRRDGPHRRRHHWPRPAAGRR